MKASEKIANERAKRLRKLRAMAGLTRKAMTEKYQIPPGTLQNWEMPRFGGLSERGAHQVIQALTLEGVYARFEWLMMGVGNAPMFAPGSARYIRSPKRPRSPEKLNQESAYFTSRSKKQRTYQLNDDSMSPQFTNGDVFIGVSRSAPRELMSLVNRLCIIQLDPEKTILRYVKSINPTRKTITLFTHYPNGNCKHTYTESTYIKIWQVIWARKAISAISKATN